ncbi:MAG: chromate resistance protein ChrB domain-containing protein, partial [Betaproteobacteria bacterium]
LPTDDPAPRMRVMRTFEALGAAIMRDGVFLLPETAANRQAVERLVEYINSNAGSAHALKAAPLDTTQYDVFRRLFDRSARYEELTKTVESLRVGFGLADPSAISRVLHKQRREYDAIGLLDFFPTPARDKARDALAAAESEVRNLLFPTRTAPGEKTSERFLGRTWATRKPLWADRLACAWLVRRFVDPEATLVWLDKAQECPPGAIGFAFDGARFANSGNRITFEEMLAQLDMHGNAALMKIASIARFLEARSGTSVPEAAGVQTLLQGATRRSGSDDELLGEAEKTFDLLYEAYCDPGRK